MGGGGGDNGYQARQDQIEGQKQAARAALNAQFGIATPGASTPEPTREQFTTTPANGGTYVSRPEDNGVAQGATTDPMFNQAGYDAAEQAWHNSQSQLSNTANSRDALYQTVRDNTFNAGKARIDEQNSDATRKLKFELFARGLNGGSEDVNQNALRERTYDQGIMDLGAKADAAKAGFRGNDEATRLSLLQSIDSGMDQGSALSSAVNQMQVNADKAASEANGSAIGDLFANTGLIYNRSQASQGKQAGTDWWNQYSTSRKAPGPSSPLVTSTGG